MERRVINPWKWQDQYGFAQAVEISGHERVLYCAGQTSVDENGKPLHPGDMRAQLIKAFENVEVVLEEAGYRLADIVRLNINVTDVDAFLEAHEAFVARLEAGDCRAASMLLGVSKLAFPGLMVEIEATAAK